MLTIKDQQGKRHPPQNFRNQRNSIASKKSRAGTIPKQEDIPVAATPGVQSQLSIDAPARNRKAREELLAGFGAPAAFISSKYLYDPLGSRLFDAITQLPEYYLTRTEAKIFSRHLEEVAAAVGPGTAMIDLGAGNGEKAKALFGALRPAQYVAVDISADYLRDALSSLRCHFPDLEITGLGLDFAAGLSLPETVREENRLFFYAGSSIGNFTPEEAGRFLANIKAQCRKGGGLLIGVDLVKDKSILDAAYDDALGVTSAFNLNVLNQVNALLGSDFDVRHWRHRGFYNPAQSRVEMHLEARRVVTVRWPGGERRFAQGEHIHTENSYKYRLDDFRALLNRAGFGSVSAWTDENRPYAVFHATA